MQKIIFNTAGDGYWSGVVNAQVEITDMKIGFADEHLEFGELLVYFDTKTWNVDDHGLIYTDSLFIRQLRKFLNEHGLPGSDVDYSEQGMQSDDYVSLDVGAKFLKAWGNKFDTDWNKFLDDQEAAYKAIRGNNNAW